MSLVGQGAQLPEHAQQEVAEQQEVGQGDCQGDGDQDQGRVADLARVSADHYTGAATDDVDALCCCCREESVICNSAPLTLHLPSLAK